MMHSPCDPLAWLGRIRQELVVDDADVANVNAAAPVCLRPGYCDVELRCGPSAQGAVRANKLVLATVSSTLHSLLSQAAEGEDAVVYLPDLDADDVHRCVDAIHAHLGRVAGCDALSLPAGAAGLLGISETGRHDWADRRDLPVKQEASATTSVIAADDASLFVESAFVEPLDFEAVEAAPSPSPPPTPPPPPKRKRGRPRKYPVAEPAPAAAPKLEDVKPSTDSEPSDFEADENDIDYDDDDVDDEPPPSKRKRKKRGRPENFANFRKMYMKGEAEGSEDEDGEGSGDDGDDDDDARGRRGICDVDSRVDRKKIADIVQRLRLCKNIDGVERYEEINLDNFRLRKKELRCHTRMMTIVGIKVEEGEGDGVTVRGKPLAWGHDRTVDIDAQHKEAAATLKHVGGFSDEQIFLDNQLCLKQGVNYLKMQKVWRVKTMRKLRPLSHDELKSELVRCKGLATEVQKQGRPIEDCDADANGADADDADDADDKKPARPPLLPEVFDLNLDPKLQPTDFSQVGMLIWTKSARGTVKFRRFGFSEARKAESCTFALKLLFDMWVSKHAKKFKSEYMLKEHERIYHLCQTPVLIEKLLEKRVPEKMCPTCGKLFPYLTNRDKSKFSSHQREHSFELHECQCGIDFPNLAAKKKHVLVVHGDGQYAACDSCKFVGTKIQLATHIKNYHKTYVCEICGRLSQNQSLHAMHLNEHRTFKCDQCDAEILGRNRFKSHVDREHNGPYICEICSSVFPKRGSLRDHMKRVHTADEDKPFKCEECGKGFIDNQSKRTHLMNIHIKSRPFTCRYGCGVAYNDTSNRNCHEKKKHGGIFIPASASAPTVSMILKTETENMA